MSGAPATPVRVAVIGCGWWATRAHLPALQAHPDARIAALVDPDPARRARAGQAYGDPPGFGSVEALLAATEVDAAVVATPHHAHHAAAAPLLDAGVHVLVEKPLTIAPEDARDLARRAAGGRREELAEPDEAARSPEAGPGRTWSTSRAAARRTGRRAAFGVAAVELVDAMYRSAAAGRIVPVGREEAAWSA